MPTYEYVCDSCGHNFDVFQKMTDAPIKTCPKCGNEVRQVFSAGFGLNFSGKGFYSTDSSAKTEKKSDTAAKTADNAPTHSCGCSCGCSCSS